MKSPSIPLSIVAAVTMTFGLSTSSAYADCPADVNGDHHVDGVDLGILLNDWNSPFTPQSDINDDGLTNGVDLGILLTDWGPCGFGGTPSVGITLVIDPRDLNLHINPPTNCKAWVAGWANVHGGDNTTSPFQALQKNPTTHVVSFKPQLTGSLQMIQIYGDGVTGTTTISTGTSRLTGGQLQIYVSCPTNGTVPTGPVANYGNNPLGTDVTVTQVPPPPYINSQTHVPFDIVEFSYIPPTDCPAPAQPCRSTFNLSGVNGLVVPMTMSVTSQANLGSVGIGPDITRDKIGTAYTAFMGNDHYGGVEFQKLRYDSSPQPIGSCYASAPTAPASQFFAIVNPWHWISSHPTCNPPTTFWNTYWNDVLERFFVNSACLEISLGYDNSTSYTGTCAPDPHTQVLTYTFKDAEGLPVNHGNCPSNTPLKFPKPQITTDTISQSAALLFGNTATYLQCSAFPTFPGGQIIDAILEAFNRGVALDGLNPQPSHIASAKSIGFFKPALGDPLGIAKITTTNLHGMPVSQLPQPYRVKIASVTGVPQYNGIWPTAATDELIVLSTTEFTFQYAIGGLPVNSPYPIINNVIPDVATGSASVTVQTAPTVAFYVGEVVYFGTGPYLGQHTITGVDTTNTHNFKIDSNGNTEHQTSVSICWRLLAAGLDGTVAPVGASSIAWNNSNNWYGAPGNTAHTPQPYNTYSKFLHYSTIVGTDSRTTGGLPIFINNRAYGFALDERPVGPYTGGLVSPKFDGTIPQGSTINLTLSPWVPVP